MDKKIKVEAAKISCRGITGSTYYMLYFLFQMEDSFYTILIYSPSRKRINLKKKLLLLLKGRRNVVYSYDSKIKSDFNNFTRIKNRYTPNETEEFEINAKALKEILNICCSKNENYNRGITT